MSSITSGKSNNRTVVRPWAVAVWLLIWEAASILIGQEILLVSPVSVVVKLKSLVFESNFWQTILFSFCRIVAGFLIATLTGTVFAALSACFRAVEELLAPVMLTIKATPVASFIILVLIWVPSRNLSVITSFLMVLPIIYTNVLIGIRSTDPKLLEMAELFRVPLSRKIIYIYLSQVMPYFQTACSVGLGMCWKAGVAAEVIGIPTGSIGEKLYKAKIYLETPDLFAWTLVIIVISILFERFFLLLLLRVVRRLERM